MKTKTQPRYQIAYQLSDYRPCGPMHRSIAAAAKRQALLIRQARWVGDLQGIAIVRADGAALSDRELFEIEELRAEGKAQ